MTTKQDIYILNTTETNRYICVRTVIQSSQHCIMCYWITRKSANTTPPIING